MPEKHFFEQRKHAEEYLIPFFHQQCPNFEKYQILDVGCAEAGFLDALHTARISGMGLEPAAERIAISKRFNPALNILHGDITDSAIVAKMKKKFDLIVLRDVIEHIADKDTVLKHLSALLHDDGFIYVTFPPRWSPFGGHQQNGKSILRRIPYLHLLPVTLLRRLGKAAGEDPQVIESIIAQRRNGLTLGQFEALCHRLGYQIYRKDLFLFRPVFKVRYGLPSMRMPEIPLLREFLVLGCEALLKRSQAAEW